MKHFDKSEKAPGPESESNNTASPVQDAWKESTISISYLQENDAQMEMDRSS